MQAEKAGGTGFPPPDAKADADKKTMPQQIAAGAKQNGQYNVKTGRSRLRLWHVSAKPITAAQAAKTKGGATDTTEPDMVIGMAQAAQGKYADAATTFGGISQSNPASARVVRLWAYFAKAKANPATAAAATVAAIKNDTGARTQSPRPVFLGRATSRRVESGMNLVIGFAPFILFALLSRLSADLALWVAFAAAFVVTIRDFVESPSLQAVGCRQLPPVRWPGLGAGLS